MTYSVQALVADLEAFSYSHLGLEKLLVFLKVKLGLVWVHFLLVFITAALS